MESSTLSSKTTNFTPFERWGIAIAGIYFIIGFPANVLSIIVCFKSLFYRYFRRLDLKKRRKNLSEKFDQISFNHVPSPSKPCKLKMNKTETVPIQQRLNAVGRKLSHDHSRQNFMRTSQSSPNMSHLEIQFLSSKQQQNKGRHNDASSKQIEVNQKNSFLNPHRKCFELYLIEISFCDLFIIGYNFLEWLLLILSEC